MNLYTMDGNRSAQNLAERRVWDYLGCRLDTFLVDDCTADTSYQERDIDYIWYRVSGDTDEMKEYNVEVKGDRQDTGNFFFEIISNEELGSAGCIMNSEADLLFYVFLNDFSLYVIPLKNLREWIEKNKSKYEEKRVGTMVGENWYTSIGIAVPINDIVSDINGVARIQI